MLRLPLPSARRSAALLCVVALSGATAAPMDAWASGARVIATAPATTTTSTVVPPTTSTTTTTLPRPTTTTKGTPPVTGVPTVPVGGPPTTTVPAKKGAPPPAPPNPDPILTAVHTDLSQLQAIDDYTAAQDWVASSQEGVMLAGWGLQGAQGILAQAVGVQALAEARYQGASAQLRQLAIAAYIGLGSGSPSTGPQGIVGGDLATVNNPGGLTGIEATDAQEMIRLIGQRARADVHDAGQQLKLAEKVTSQARRGAQGAQRLVGDAKAELLSSRQNLKLIVAAATTPGLASTMHLLSQPGAAAGSTTTSTPATTADVAATQLRGAVDAAVTVPAPASPTILGATALTGAELAAWYTSTGHKANTTVPIGALAGDYQAAGKATGVRYDLAFAQSIVETGYFSFPSYGQLTAKDNNFAGIGACDSCATGWSFPNAQTGVSAQLELLEAYASIQTVPTPLLRGPVGVGGCCQTWTALAGKWASSVVYGISIMTVYNQMLTWVIPRRLVAAGLVKPAPPSAKKAAPPPPAGAKKP